MKAISEMKSWQHFGLISMWKKKRKKIDGVSAFMRDSLVKDALKKCFMLKMYQVCLQRAKVQSICQHPWRGMHVLTHRHQKPIPGGKLTASNQERTTTSNNGSGRGSLLPLQLLLPKAKPLSMKATTVTSQPQAGKSCFGCWQRKFSRSLALTSCCHWAWAEKLHEQPHTKPLAALPKGKWLSAAPTVQVHTSDVQIWTVFLDFPWCTLRGF